MDCGALQVEDLNAYSDTYAYVGKSARFTVSCYLIKHADTYMLWNTGLPDEDLGLPLVGTGSKGESLTKSLPDQLAAVGVDPTQIAIIGLSHYHLDHTGAEARSEVKSLQPHGNRKASRAFQYRLCSRRKGL